MTRTPYRVEHLEVNNPDEIKQRAIHAIITQPDVVEFEIDIETGKVSRVRLKGEPKWKPQESEPGDPITPIP